MAAELGRLQAPVERPIAVTMTFEVRRREHVHRFGDSSPERVERETPAKTLQAAEKATTAVPAKDEEAIRSLERE